MSETTQHNQPTQPKQERPAADIRWIAPMPPADHIYADRAGCSTKFNVYVCWRCRRCFCFPISEGNGDKIVCCPSQLSKITEELRSKEREMNLLDVSLSRKGLNKRLDPRRIALHDAINKEGGLKDRAFREVENSPDCLCIIDVYTWRKPRAGKELVDGFDQDVHFACGASDRRYGIPAETVIDSFYGADGSRRQMPQAIAKFLRSVWKYDPQLARSASAAGDEWTQPKKSRCRKKGQRG